MPTDLGLAADSEPVPLMPSDTRATPSSLAALAAEATDLLAAATRHAAAFAERLRPEGASSKADASPVTAADLALQAWLVMGLRERGLLDGADCEVVGEESTAIFASDGGSALRTMVHGLVREARGASTATLSAAAIDDAIDAGYGAGTAARQWIIDPIDGTRGYLRGQQYCVCLAYVERGQVLYGGAGCPRIGRGLIARAWKGGGAWGDDGLAVTRSPRALLARRTPGSTFVASESSEANDRARKRLRRLAAAMVSATADFSTVSMESQCKFVLVATGDADLAVRFPPRDPARSKDMVWDYAGAVVMAEEAGARMTDCEGRALVFGQGRHIVGNRGVLCAAPWIHADAVTHMPPAEPVTDEGDVRA